MGSHVDDSAPVLTTEPDKADLEQPLQAWPSRSSGLRSRLSARAPYAIAVLSTVFYFRDAILSSRLPGTLGDARWTVAVFEHWFEVWQGDESLRDMSFFYPQPNTLGMSDAFLVQGQFHALGRLLGLDIVPAWLGANMATYLVGALGVAFLSGLVLRTTAFRCAFVACACLSYPLIAMIGHPQVLGFLSVSWIFVGVLLASRGGEGGYGVYLVILAIPLLVVSSWYAAILGVAVLATLTAFLALLTPRRHLASAARGYVEALRASLAQWYGKLIWGTSAALWSFAVLTYLPARRFSASTVWAEVINYLPRLSDVVNASAGGGGIWRGLYEQGFDSANIEYELLLGFTPLVGLSLLLAALAALRALAVARESPGEEHDRLTVPWPVFCLSGTLTIAAIVAALLVDERGHSAFRLAFEFVPGFDTVRAPYRVQILLYPLAILVTLLSVENWLVKRQSSAGTTTLRRASRKRTFAAGFWVISTVMAGAFVIEMFRPAQTGWASEEILPASLQAQLPTVRDSCDSFVLNNDSFPGVPVSDMAVHGVMLSVLSDVPTPGGYSRGVPRGHPGFGGSEAALIAWMRTKGYKGDVCVVSAEGVRLVQG